MSIVSRLIPIASASLLFVATSVTVRADADTKANPPAKPVFQLKPTVSARVGFDDNVFLQDRADILPGVTNAVPDRASSWVARASITLDAAWSVSPALRLTAGYAPEVVRYEAYSSESHDNHRVDLAIGGQDGAWNYQLKGNLLFVNGTDVSPTYGHTGGGPAIGGANVRARREQLAPKLGGHVTRQLHDGSGFVRLTGEVAANDFRTHQLNTTTAPGYANYIDRSESTAGIEAGRFLRPDFALITAVRAGEQRQDNLLGVGPNYTHTLARLLVGVEGKPGRKVSLRMLAGPDLRRFGDAVAPGFDRTRTARYIEASATWTPCVTDTISFTAKDGLLLSSGGRGAYQHTGGNIQWKHTFDAKWSASFAADVQVGDSRDYLPAATRRLDWIYTGAINIARVIAPKTKLDLEIAREWSDSAVSDQPGREYTHWLVTFGIRQMF